MSTGLASTGARHFQRPQMWTRILRREVQEEEKQQGSSHSEHDLSRHGRAASYFSEEWRGFLQPRVQREGGLA